MIKTFQTVKILTSFFVLSVMFTNAYPNPLLEVDNAHFDAGTIEEGTLKLVKHTFNVINTGNKNLRIHKIKPG